MSLYMGPILYYIAAYQILSKEAVFLFVPDRRYAERVLRSALDKGYIQQHTSRAETKVQYLPGKTDYKTKRIVNGKREKKKTDAAEIHRYFQTTKYYSITEAGLRYLKKQDMLPDAFKAREEETKKLLGTLRKKGIDRLLGTSTANVMYSFFGSNAGVDAYGVDYRRIYLENEYGYANAKTIKAVAGFGGIPNDLSSAGIPSRDYDRGRYSGCLFSEKTAIAVYANLEPGFAWSKQLAQSEYRAFEIFAREIKHENELEDNMKIYGCVLVKNPKHFAQIFLDLPGARRMPSKSDGAFQLGKPFTGFFAIPINSDGAENLEFILLDKHSDTGDIFKMLRNADSFTGSPEQVRPTFPLCRRENGIDVCYGVEITLNMIQLSNMKKAMEMYPQYSYGVACMGWQVPYFKAVFGQEFRTISLTHKRSSGRLKIL